MAKILNVRWGIPPSIEVIKSDLNNFIDTELGDIVVKHIKTGFTDNVFFIKAAKSTCILKEFTEDWHLREAKIYQDILSKDSCLGAPKLLYTNSNRIYLEYFSPKIYKKIDKTSVSTLYEWLIYKFHTYLNKPITNLIEQKSIRKHYLFEKPLKKIFEISSHVGTLENKYFQYILKKEKFIELIFENNPQFLTLEHGDIETQNLYKNLKNSKLAVIDWTNSKFSDSLTDINQFLENCKSWQLDEVCFYQKFKKDLAVTDFDFYLKRNRLFWSLNKFHYYISKFKDGNQISTTNNENTYKLSLFYIKQATEILNTF